ncbi:imelysin family protein [Microvirga sp. 17 mud 1-3]|uniref:imelysin family protein n=1 Tax=Microvirga sp. 17 mud 1-3 TaxID=2082949 RepID=UPI000D6D630C|nr:imelysin family protein [Microvirga sp. 17 mud 1-3]AWM86740.1 peptidase [Microvirga sp. 17 mud 1-3]
MRARALAALLVGTALIGPARAEAPQPKAVIETYISLAQAMYGDAAGAARDLSKAVDAFLTDPTEQTLTAAREAWRKARMPYQQTEGFRFGNKVMDELEGKVNAWPLDEGLIDYVDAKSYGETSDENPLYRANVIANKTIRIGKKQVDASKITKELLSDVLQEAGGVEANVATGYHAIEFLLWGQDLNGTGPGAGVRPATDYSLKDCTNGNCDRRRDYLKAATALLVDDLTAMAKAWDQNGKARQDILKKGPNEGLATILTGLGSLSYGELAGERMKLGLILHDPEEEHDCFSDNTHNSHYGDQIGMVAIYEGRYARTDGKTVEGPSMAAYARTKAPEEAAKLEAAMKNATEKLRAIKDRADSGKEAYDQMIAEGNAEGNKLVQEGVDALVAQARAIEGLVKKLGLKISVEGSQSLDEPSAVAK